MLDLNTLTLLFFIISFGFEITFSGGFCIIVSSLISLTSSSICSSGFSSSEPIISIDEPSETLSPTFKLTFLTLPEYGLGISTLDLSLSIVIIGSSLLIFDPASINTSITSTSLKSPMFGTNTSFSLIIILWA